MALEEEKDPGCCDLYFSPSFLPDYWPKPPEQHVSKSMHCCCDGRVVMSQRHRSTEGQKKRPPAVLIIKIPIGFRVLGKKHSSIEWMMTVQSQSQDIYMSSVLPCIISQECHAGNWMLACYVNLRYAVQWNSTSCWPWAYSQKAKEALNVTPGKQSLAFISMTDLVTFCAGNIFTHYQARVLFSSDSETPPLYNKYTICSYGGVVRQSVKLILLSALGCNK